MMKRTFPTPEVAEQVIELLKKNGYQVEYKIVGTYESFYFNKRQPFASLSHNKDGFYVNTTGTWMSGERAKEYMNQLTEVVILLGQIEAIMEGA